MASAAMDADIVETPPQYEEVPLDIYADVMPVEEDFEVHFFSEEPRHDSNYYDHLASVDLLDAKPVVVNRANAPKPPKPKNIKKQEVLPSVEFVDQFIAIPDSLRDTVIGRYAIEVAQSLEFPEASCFMSFLGCASAAAACNFAVQYRFKKSIPIGLYVIIEQPPSTQKSRILGYALDTYLERMSQHNSVVFGKLREAKEGDPELYSWLRPGFVSTTDATTASMDKHMSGLSEGRFVIASDEKSILTSLFPGPGSYSSNNELVLKGYGGERVAGMRSGRQAFNGIANGTVSIIAQYGAASRILKESDGSGMAERFFFVSEPSYLGSRTFDEQPIDFEIEKAYDRAVATCVSMYSQKVLHSSNANPETRKVLDPANLDQLRATTGGYDAIKEYRRAMEPRLLELSNTGDMVMLSWLGKFEAHVLKIAAVLHVYECIGNGSKVSEVIPDKLLFAAMELVEIMSDHQQQLIRDSGDSGTDAEEQAVVECLSSARLGSRALLQKVRYRKPFSSMGKNGYGAAKKRIERMIEQGQLVINAQGTLEVV